MSSLKKPHEKLKRCTEKIQVLMDEQKRLLAQTKKADRNARTKRLIETGAIMDSIGIDSIDSAVLLKKMLLEDDLLLQKFLHEKKILDAKKEKEKPRYLKCSSVTNK